MSVKRKVNHDGTLQINKNLYETDVCLAKKSVEVRYEPEWLSDPSCPLSIFDDNGQKVAEARFVNLSDNCKVRRKGQYSKPKPEDSADKVIVQENISSRATCFSAVYNDKGDGNNV